MIKKLSRVLELAIIRLTKEIQHLNYIMNNKEDTWSMKTGKRFNEEIIYKYAISEDEWFSIAETVAKFVTQTRITNIDKYLFLDEKLESPRLPYMFNNNCILDKECSWKNWNKVESR